MLGVPLADEQTTPGTAPRPPARPRRFYGRYVLAVCMLGAFLSSGTSQLFMSIMLKPLAEDFGQSRSAIAGAVTLGSTIAGLASPVAGRLADRYGPRPLSTLGAVVVGVLFLVLASVGALWQFYGVYVVARAVSGSTLAGVVPMTATANWFRRLRGRAMGLLAMSTPLGGAALTAGGQLVLESAGWRTVFVLFGVAMLGLLVLPAALVLRRRPEDLGLLPDGATAPTAADGTTRPLEPEGGWSFREAVRTRALWLLIAAGTIGSLVNSAVGFHQVAYYTDMGIAATAAALSLSLYAFSGALANGVWGWLTERYSERILAMLAAIVTAGAVLYVLTVRSVEGALVFSVVFGITSRGESTLLSIILAHYYGRQAYGAITGFVHPFLLIGLGLGPLVAALSFDLAGTYQAVFSAAASVCLITAVLYWLARRPTPPARLAEPHRAPA
jgi:MFS transporter, OFA family, oxalate/formate antiporter